VTRSLSTILALAIIVSASATVHADGGEDLALPTYRKPGLIQFKVKEGEVASVAVQVATYARDGRVDRQIFALTPGSDRGAFPTASGYRMWESDKIYAATDQWRANRGNIDRIELTYVVHKIGAGGQRSAVESKGIYTVAGKNEGLGATGAVPRVGNNPGLGLDKLDPREVQAAVDRLAKRPPAARYKALPGFYPHPLHAENDLVKAIKSVTAQKRANPGKDLFIRFSIYNQDSPHIAGALCEAHRAGVKVEGLTDWSQATPRLASKPAFDALRSAGISIASIVRNGPGNGDIRTNHTKFWILGEKDNAGRIVRGTTFDCSFNTEFTNYPGNQEAMTAFRNNKDVAVVYNHVFQAMKGNAPLRLELDPGKAKFMLNHPLFPYVTRDGKSFSARDAMYTFINKAQKSLSMLDYVQADRDIAGAMGARAQKGVRVDWWGNAFWAPQSPNTRVLHDMGVNAHLVKHQNGGSPIHHKEGVADGKWVRGGSLNPGWWSFESDETMYVIRSKSLGKQVLAQANRLSHAGYPNENLRGGTPTKQTQNVQFEVRLPRGVNVNDVQGVYFAGGGSSELGNMWVELTKVGGSGGADRKTVYRGSRQLPLGFNHQGKPVIVMKNGQKVYSSGPDTFFTVQPRSSGRQRIATGFKR
jgi:hypothetical protein